MLNQSKFGPGPPRTGLRRLLAACALGSAAALSSGCGESDRSTSEDDASRQVSEALTPTQPGGVRPNINSFSSAQRTTLANAILAFITQPVLDEHANAHDWHHPAVGELFFIRHHEYLNQLESYLLTHGHAAFVPVPEWDPGTPIPTAFRVADPLVTQAAMNANPNEPVPPEFADNRLCDYPSASALAISVEPWHDDLHTTVGGAMSAPATAPGAPIFWLWHGLLDDMYHERAWRCETLPAIVTAVLR